MEKHHHGVHNVLNDVQGVPVCLHFHDIRGLELAHGFLRPLERRHSRLQVLLRGLPLQLYLIRLVLAILRRIFHLLGLFIRLILFLRQIRHQFLRLIRRLLQLLLFLLKPHLHARNQLLRLIDLRQTHPKGLLLPIKAFVFVYI